MAETGSVVKRMPIGEFRDLGYLQEINRRFLHPLGLALEVLVDENEAATLGGVWDFRDDPEGLVFADGLLDGGKASYVADEWSRRGVVRQAALGFVVQPVT